MTAFDTGSCWRSIGVQGDRSCEALARHAHCRNCPVYGNAARHSLTRPVEPDYDEYWARELARPDAAADTSAASLDAALVFRVGAEWLAVPLALAASVAPIAPVHRLPHRGGAHSHHALLGIAAAGGKLLPAVSLARLLDIDSETVPATGGRHAFRRLLVLAEPGAPSFALPVDEVHGVLRHAPAALQPPAATVGRAPPPLLAGVLSGALDGTEAAGRAAAGMAGIGLLDAGALMAALKGLLR